MATHDEGTIGEGAKPTGKKKVSPARNAIAMVLLLAFSTVAYLEWHTNRQSGAAISKLNETLDNEDGELLSMEQVEDLIGRKLDGPAVEENGALKVTYTWKGIFRQYGFTAIYKKQTPPKLIRILMANGEGPPPVEPRAAQVPGSMTNGVGPPPVKPRAGQVRGKRSQNIVRLAIEGQRLTDDQARALGDAVKLKPDDLESRVKLLGYFMTRQNGPAARTARQAHVIWLIENQPRNPVVGMGFAGLNPKLDGDAYTRAKTLWDKHVEANPKDTAILGNSAAFLLPGHRDEAEALLERCRQLEPANRVWPQRLAQLLRQKLNESTGGDRKRFAAQAVKEFEQALELNRGDNQTVSLLPDLAKTSFEAGEYEKAKGYATKLIDRVNEGQTTSSAGNATHVGNIVLGRLALVAGDLPAASAHLLAAGTTPGSPTLNSLGPNMTLAKELLERGETQAVLEYFDLCAKFWRGDRGRLKAWTDTVKAGKVPHFGET